MPPVGFEPTFSAGKRPKTYALDRAATGTGIQEHYCVLFLHLICIHITQSGTKVTNPYRQSIQDQVSMIVAFTEDSEVTDLLKK